MNKELFDKGLEIRKSVLGKEFVENAIRNADGSATRSLGEAGKKKGLTTTLPLAFDRLQAEGEIRRYGRRSRGFTDPTLLVRHADDSFHRRLSLLWFKIQATFRWSAEVSSWRPPNRASNS